jgi:hypothetical protein
MAKSKKGSKMSKRTSSKSKKSIRKSQAGRRFVPLSKLRAASPKMPVEEVIIVEKPFTGYSQASPNRYFEMVDEEPIDFGDMMPIMTSSNYRYSPDSFVMGGRKSRY